MKIKIFAYLAAGCAILSVSNASVTRLCYVAYERNGAISEEVRIRVGFYTGDELNRSSGDREYTPLKSYAIVEVDGSRAVLELQKRIIGVGEKFDAKDFERGFRLFSTKEAVDISSKSGTKFIIRAKKDDQWVDSRLN